MQTLKIEANYRTDMSKSRAKQLRREGYVTASVSGKNRDTIPVEVKMSDLADKIKHSEGGITSLIDMQVNGGPADSSGTVIIKHFTKDAVSRRVIDVVFQRVVMDRPIHVAVPVELVGEAPGIQAGGIMEQMADEINVSCLPKDIPSTIQVDVSHMQIGDVIRAHDLNLGKGVELLADPDTIVCTCRGLMAAPLEETTVSREAAEEAIGEAEAAEEESEETTQV